jgi:hypothetical protein
MDSSLKNALFHEAHTDTGIKKQLGVWIGKQDVEFTYTFENFFHPFVGELIAELNKKSVGGLLDPDFHKGLKVEFFDAFYTALSQDATIVHAPKEIDFRSDGPYANYNWELLFHVPLTIAVHLSKNQRFAEARRWFHYIFDPTSNDAAVAVPQRFWRFLPFRTTDTPKQIDAQLAQLSSGTPEAKALLQGLEAIRNDPFQPHKVARTRQLAYQYYVVMKYLDNLVAWGDSLFQQDTIESINEATQLYVLAANLLGARPQRIPPSGTVPPKTFADLRKKGLDALSNALVELEGKFPMNLGMPTVTGGDPDAAGPLFGIGRALYFCIPRNEKLIAYWDTVGDRLFKIRHCMNIQGMVRQLALYDPPLDPGMLVKAAAAGINLGAILQGLNQPVSPVRPLPLIHKALDLCAELRALGSSLLTAIEKGENEHLLALRQGHELQIQKKQQEVRFLQWAAAQETTKLLGASRQAPLERLRYYKRLLGLPADPNAADHLPLSFEGMNLTEENFANVYNELVARFDLPVALEAYAPLNMSSEEGRARMHLSANEDDEFVHSKRARDIGLAASICHTMAGAFSPIPDADGNMHFWGLGITLKSKIGTSMVSAAKSAGDVLGVIASWERDQAALASRTALYERRTDEWIYQHNLAAIELKQIGRQMLVSLITEQIAFHEYNTLKTAIDNAQEVDRFLREKFSGEDLYNWMQGEVSRLYYEYYRFACDTARKAERTMKHELMRKEVDETNYIKFDYWDGGHKGLLSGEALYLDVKRMELAYLENSKREYELIRHVSLRQLDPAALLALQATGTCELHVPEWTFDLDAPGHYLRRIKMIGLSIPCVSGPYTSVNCTLTLTRSTLRKSAQLDDGYTRAGSEDQRFIDYFGAIESIVTSSGQNDSGMFDPVLRDEHPLPFEGAGVDSVWKLELPDKYRQFDYRTVSDVVLHIRYTARPGGAPLRDAAVAYLEEASEQARELEFGVLLNLRYDFPGEWQSFAKGTDDFSAKLQLNHFPYLAQYRGIALTGYELYGIKDDRSLQRHTTGNQAMFDAATEALNDKQAFLFTAPANGPGASPVLKRMPDADVWLIVRYRLK